MLGLAIINPDSPKANMHLNCQVAGDLAGSYDRSHSVIHSINTSHIRPTTAGASDPLPRNRLRTKANLSNATSEISGCT